MLYDGFRAFQEYHPRRFMNSNQIVSLLFVVNCLTFIKLELICCLFVNENFRLWFLVIIAVETGLYDLWDVTFHSIRGLDLKFNPVPAILSLDLGDIEKNNQIITLNGLKSLNCNDMFDKSHPKLQKSTELKIYKN